MVSDTTKPFLVQSGDLLTTVLGTSFNINAYPENDQMAVTVATGEVQVRPASADRTNHSSNSMILTPAEQAQFSAQSGQLTKQTVSLDTTITWKDGILRFEGNTLAEIIPLLERWYGVTITLKDQQQDLCDLRLTFDNLSLTQALKQLQLTTGATYRKVEQDVYEIFGAGCKN
ncbi:MAG: FecR domain-containing protein [Bacteroidota bacterium]